MVNWSNEVENSSLPPETFDMLASGGKESSTETSAQ